MSLNLTIKQERFSQEYVVLGNASAAYRRVYNAAQMTDEAVHVSASRVKAKVWLRIKELQAIEAERYTISRSEVLKIWLQIATADVNEIVQIRRKSCTRCFEGEYKAEPNIKCQKCGGEGEVYIHVADTRHLTGAARVLYAGARKTREGVEVILRDQDAALINLARTLNMFNQPEDKVADKATLIENIKKVTDPLEASKIYQQIMVG